MTDEPQLPEAELAALADGSLPADRAQALRARIDASPELAAALAEQQRAVALMRRLDEPAPASLRARVDELTSASGVRTARADRASRRPRWRSALFLPAATALAIAVAAIVVALGGGGTSGPTVPQTARLALAAARLPAPATDRADPDLLALRIGGLAFPSYTAEPAWHATGARLDTLHGRRVATVFYAVRGKIRVGYAIVSGRPLSVYGGTTKWQGGVHYTVQTVDGARLVTWQRAGHTCVVAARGASASLLLSLAVAEERGPAS